MTFIAHIFHYCMENELCSLILILKKKVYWIAHTSNLPELQYKTWNTYSFSECRPNCIITIYQEQFYHLMLGLSLIKCYSRKLLKHFLIFEKELHKVTQAISSSRRSTKHHCLLYHFLIHAALSTSAPPSPSLLTAADPHLRHCCQKAPASNIATKTKGLKPFEVSSRLRNCGLEWYFSSHPQMQL